MAKKEMVSTSHGYTIFKPVASVKVASKQQPSVHTKRVAVTSSSSSNMTQKSKCASQRASGFVGSSRDGDAAQQPRHRMRARLQRHFPQQQRMQPSKTEGTRQPQQVQEHALRPGFGGAAGNSSRRGHRLGGVSSSLNGTPRHFVSVAQQQQVVRQAWTRIEVSRAKST